MPFLTRAFPADSTLDAAFTYDQGGHGSGIGRLTSLTDQAGSLSRNYDERGLVTADARTIGGNAYTTGFTYESAGRLSSVTYASSGWLVAYARDAAGQVSSVTAKRPGFSPVNVATSITYQPFGPMKNLTWANGVASSRIFDVDYRMTSLTDAGTGNIQFISYGYDAANNVTGIGDNVTPANNQTLTYDTLSRINYASGSYGTMSSITYDSNSNLTRYNNTGYTVAGTSNQQTKSGSTNITYTSTGGMNAVGASFTMTWNKADQLATAAAFGTTNAYGYDAFGQRLTSKAGAAPALVQQYGLDGMLLETAGGTGAVVSDYVWLDGIPIAYIKPSTAVVYPLHTDRLGTPLRGTDATQATVWTANYGPFGSVTPTGSITVALRLPGQTAVDASPFYRNGARDYYPAVPRYLQPDLIGLEGGINTYSYVVQNPYKWIDPSGLDDPDQYNMHMGYPVLPGFAEPAPTTPPVIAQPAGFGRATGTAGTQCNVGEARGIVTPNGVEVRGFTSHGVDRAIGDFSGRRGVSPSGILDALKNPLQTKPVRFDAYGRPSQRFIGREGEIVVNPQTGKIISINPTSASKANRLLGGQ